MNGTGELVLDDEIEDTPAPHKAKPQRAEVFAEPLPPMKSPPPVLPAVPGLPNVEDHPDVKAARADYARVRGEYESARAERIELGGRLGLKPGEHAHGKVERLAARMLADGQSTDEIEQFLKLAVQERRLLMALELLIPDIAAALSKARREVQPEVRRTVMAPANRAVALARLELARAVKARDDAVWRMQRCGLDAGAGVFGEGVTSDLVRQWVRDGFISAEEAAPFLS